jgi:predicted enzyme related to lactoylglutathione lyase
MSERDGYIPGVPCWVETSQPNPDAAAEFYSRLFGWDIADAMPPGAEGAYLMGRIRGGDVAAISSMPPGAPQAATWNTYVWVESAEATTAAARDAGGTVVTEPFEVVGAGRMAVLADPEGAGFCLWQAGEHRGSRVVNEHGSVIFNDLHTRDVERASSFYGAVFGWQLVEFDGGAMWALPGYGDHLEEQSPGLRKQMAEAGAPPGFVDVVAAVVPIADEQADVPSHWGVTFAVDDADAIARTASDLGGTVVVTPFDAPWVRMTVLADPNGATFTASQFVPENAPHSPSPEAPH